MLVMFLWSQRETEKTLFEIIIKNTSVISCRIKLPVFNKQAILYTFNLHARVVTVSHLHLGSLRALTTRLLCSRSLQPSDL